MLVGTDAKENPAGGVGGNGIIFINVYCFMKAHLLVRGLSGSAGLQ